jgi:hypothetical protein
MPKLTPAQMKKAVEEFKKQFTGGFYHGSPSNKIKAFDSTKNTDPMKLETPGVTFVTRDPDFAESFLPGSERGGYKAGATMYPVKVKLGKHWNPEQEESQQVLKAYLEKMYPHEANPQDLVDIQKDMSRAEWTDIENPNFLQHLRDTGHDSFHVMEGGIPNVGVLKPENIRGKFADYNPDEAMNPDFMKAEGGLIHLAGGGKVPEAVVKAYKLFRTKANKPDELYPLFVNANKPEPIGEWTNAEVGPVAASGKVKSKLGELAYRPGWHAGDLPIATHIGGKSDPKLKAPDFRRPDEVWAEVEMPNDVDWQTIANQRAELNKAGVPIARTAHITDQLPEGGHYRYKTSPNMEGNWLIGGGMKVNKVLTDEEVQAINSAAGKADLPRFSQFDKPRGTPEDGMAAGGSIAKKFLEHARKVPFVHYSQAPNISTLDPNRYGTGIKGAEAKRLVGQDDIRPRSYIYTDRPDVRPEAGLGSHKYSGVAEDMYPLHEDPMGFSAIAKQKAIDPYMMQFGREMVDEKAHLNELERLIKGAGYRGYANDDVGLLFHPTDVQKAE